MTNLNWFEFNIDIFLLVFIVLNIVNVIIQTIKSIVTITGTPMVAASINAITYAIYTVVVVFMNADGLGVIWKALIIGAMNFIGVYVVKWWENKMRKDRLWKVEATINGREVSAVKEKLQALKISYNCFRTSGEYWVFNIFCPTQNESAQVKWILSRHHAKYFVSESKTL
jgi:uncharacterized protein YebE (UPF0316 family)